MATTSPSPDQSVETIVQRLFLGWHDMERVEDLSQDEFDSLPFGAIQLDRAGRIVAYNETEGRIANRDPRAVIGKSFFEEVAPCTNVQEFAGRFRQGVESEILNEVFPFTFRFPHGTLEVWIRLYYSSNSRTAWVFVTQRDED
ncbi:MAG: PAS domain-containing protein [Acidobacteriota bacterium]